VDPSASVVCTVTPVTERQFGGEPAAEADDADGIIAMVGDQEPAPILIRVPAYWDDVIQTNAMCCCNADEQIAV